MSALLHKEIRTIEGIVFAPYSEVLQLGQALVMYGCGTCGASVSWVAGNGQDVFLALHVKYHKKEQENEKSLHLP